jgi:hypothetical protein
VAGVDRGSRKPVRALRAVPYLILAIFLRTHPQEGDFEMKKIMTVLAAASLVIAMGCVEKKTESTSTVSGTDTVSSSTTTVSTTVPTVDTATTAAVKAEVKEAGHDAADAARDAAHATGTAMETAGKEIQKQTKPPKKN